MTTDTYQIAEYSPLAAHMAELRHRFENVVFDLTTAAGNKDVRDARRLFVLLRGRVEAKRIELKKPNIDRGRLIDSEAESITEDILKMETPIQKQIKADEKFKEDARLAKIEAERARVAKHQRNIDEIRAAATGHGRASAAQIQLAIDAVLALDASAANYEELAGQAESAKTATLADLGRLKVDAEAREAEAERLRLAKIEFDLQFAAHEEHARLAREKLAADQAAQAEVERKAQVARAAADAHAQAERDAADMKAREERAEADRKAQTDRDAAQAVIDQQAAALTEQKRVADEADRVRFEEASKRITADVALTVSAMAVPAGFVQRAPGYIPHFAPTIATVAPAAGPPTFTLDMMADVLGFDLRAAFLADVLGFRPVAIEGASKLYNESDWPAICDRLIEHVSSVRGHDREPIYQETHAQAVAG